MDSLELNSIDVLLLDIEGTICPISFVKEGLFPFFIKKLPTVLSGLQFPLNEQSDHLLERICAKFPDDKKSSSEALFTYIEELVDKDAKDPILKELQGLVWKDGYEEGAIQAPLFEDAIQLIINSSKAGKKVYIYSSGSVAAQKLLIGHVEGPHDLSRYISGYFDITTSGHKNQRASYIRILDSINRIDKPSSVLFLSDNLNEVEVAVSSGMKSAIVMRPGNPPLNNIHGSYLVIDNFRNLY